MDRIPTEADWRSEPWCLDAEQAYRNLAGKSLEETIELFTDNSLIYQEDVMFMPAACFAFYASAYMEYLWSGAAKDDSDGANCFFGVIDCRLGDVLNAGPEFTAKVIEMLKHLSLRQTWFDADEAIYGSFTRKSKRLISRLGGDGRSPAEFGRRPN